VSRRDDEIKVWTIANTLALLPWRAPLAGHPKCDRCGQRGPLEVLWKMMPVADLKALNIIFDRGYPRPPRTPAEAAERLRIASTYVCADGCLPSSLSIG